MLRGRILNQNGQFKDAVEILQSALKDMPEHAGGHYQLALALGNTGNVQRAEQELREAVKIEPRLTDAQLALAQIALAKDDRNTLRQTAEQIITSLPSDSRGYILRAEPESAPAKLLPQMRTSGKPLKLILRVPWPTRPWEGGS